MVGQIPLHKPVKKWALCKDYLIYTLNEGDEGQDVLHITEITKKTTNTIKISGIGLSKDVTGLLYDGDRIYIVKSDLLEVYTLAYSESSDYSTVLDGHELPKIVADIQLKIHDIFIYKDKAVLAIEGLDNLLDFNYIYFGDEASYRSGGQQNSYLLLQTNLKAKRAKELSARDPIKKVIQRINRLKKDDNDSQQSFVIALRESGAVDYYLDFTLVDSTEPQGVIDINADQKSFYIKIRKDYKEQIALVEATYGESAGQNFAKNRMIADPIDFSYGIYVKVAQCLSRAFNFELSDESYIQQVYDFERAHIDIAKDAINLFTGVNLSGKSLVGIFSHGKVVSFFDLQTEEWIYHLQFEGNIVKFLQIKEKKQEEICVWTDDHKIFKLDIPEEITDENPPKFDLLYDGSETQEIIDVQVTLEQGYPLVIISYDCETETYKLSAFGEGGKFTDQDIEFLKDLEISDREQFAMRLIQGEKEKVIMVLQTIANEETSIKVIQVQADYGYLDIKPISSIENVETNSLMHSCVSNDPSQELILFDKNDTCFINFQSNSCHIVTNTNIKSLITESKMNVFYAIKVDQIEKQEGLYQLDVGASLAKQRPSILPLTGITRGPSYDVILGLNNSRIGFFQSYDSYTISILPNRNQNRFYNDFGKVNYAIYKQIDDKVIILNQKDNKLYSYDAVTAKLLHINECDLDLNGYEQFNDRGYETLIFSSTEPVQDFAWDMNDFYPKHMQKTTTLKQITFRQNRCPKECHRFKVVEVQSDSHIGTLLEFIYPYSKSLDLYLHINKNRDHLIARDQIGVFFYKIVKQEDGPLVKLELIRQITDFSENLQVSYKYRLDMFSPNFTRYITYDPFDGDFKGRFLLKNSFTQECVRVIDTTLLLYENKEKVSWMSPQQAVNQIQWISEDQIRIIGLNKQEVLLKVDSETQQIQQFNMIPLFDELYLPEWKEQFHLILSRQSESNPVRKLQKLYQEYKSLVSLFPETTTSSTLNTLLMKQDFENYDTVTHSFTLLSWKTAFDISTRNGGLTIDQMSQETLLALIYSIFPNGETVFHYLVKRPEELYKLLDFCHPGGKEIKHPIPFLRNYEGKTPLHLCIESGATKAANTFLRHLSLYDIDHHSRAIADLFPEMINLKLGDLDIYLESRFQQLKSHKEIEAMTLTKTIHYCTSIPVFEQWDLQGMTDISSSDGGNYRKVKVETLDISSIYHYDDPLEDKFFDELANTDEYSYFELKSIQALIDFNYPLVQKFLIRKLFLPYIAFHCSYLVLIFVLFERRYEDIWIYFYWAGLIANCVFAFYFLVNELRQISSDGINYFKSFWNYIDMIPIFGIYAIAIFSVIDGIVQLAAPEDRVSGTIQRIVVSIVTLFMWLKFLYFFRIFDKTSYMIRAVVECVKAMRYFFFILLFTIFAFGNAFLILSLGNDGEQNPDSVFIGNYIESLTFSYRMLLGDFDTGAFGETAVPLVWILFLIFTVFNIIVMLNLLVAVISDAYAEVAEVAESAMYQERASMIAENNYLIPEEDRKAYAQKGHYLVVITDLEQEEVASGNDAVIQKVEGLKQSIEKQIRDTKKSGDNSRNELKQHIKQIQNFMLQTLQPEEIQTRICKKKVQKMTYLQLKEKTGRYLSGYGCDGRHYYKCQSSENGSRKNNNEEELYHCQTCQFDICTKCFDWLGDFHLHEIKKMTLADIKILHPEDYDQGYLCDCTSFRPCPKISTDTVPDEEIIYHNEDDFDLCEKCAEYHKIEEN